MAKRETERELIFQINKVVPGINSNIDKDKTDEVQVTSDVDDKKKFYVMCPTPGCTKELVGSWKEYATDEKRNGLTVYECPECHNKFTVNDFRVNALPIPDRDGLGVVFDTKTFEIYFKVPGYARFIDADGIAYLHVPIHTLAPVNSAMVYLTDIKPEEFTDSEIVDVLRKHITAKNKKAANKKK